MKTLQTKVSLGLAILALFAASLELGANASLLARKVNEYEGQHVAKVNEYEGQHRNVSGDPSQWG